MMGEDISRMKNAQALIREINLGATAIGTGLNAPAGYAKKVTRKLRQISGLPVVQSQNLVEATQDTGAYVQLSGVLKRVAVKLSKISNDLRLLSSGSRRTWRDQPASHGSRVVYHARQGYPHHP
jgi:aspartate ammonia-lyase